MTQPGRLSIRGRMRTALDAIRAALLVLLPRFEGDPPAGGTGGAVG